MPSCILSLVIPTYNELGNIQPLIERIRVALGDLQWEVIFVDDDSPDGSAAEIRKVAKVDPRVRSIVRLGRRGLSRAVVEGMLSSSAPYLAVMDADLQHDVSRLPVMLRKLQDEQLDVVVASRFLEDSEAPEWNGHRARMSATASAMSRWVLAQPLTDPMSGFFVITRDAFERSVRSLSGEGYKILLDLFTSTAQPFRYAEVPYKFATRGSGESKLDGAVLWEFVILLIDKKLHGWVPARFVLFCLVGLSGVVAHLVVLGVLFNGLGAPFSTSQAVATFMAMTSNFAINNAVTYRDRQLRGMQWIKGWISFCLLCGLGVAANVGVATVIFERQSSWWIAGVAGAVIGAVWNYVASSVFTWRHSRSKSNSRRLSNG